MKVQDENCSLGDFHASWLQAKPKLEQIGHETAECLIRTITARVAHLLNHKVMLSAVYLDPRYKFLLDDEENLSAVHHLCELYSRIRKIEPIEASEQRISK